ncbi:hypothetical protein [Micromonospora sp. NPDC006431]|uniref:hypothetical protein n=1 Tax=Micromonospora sp. NPDC006431 TaxID=3364235 RepID=UPI0036A868C7
MTMAAVMQACGLSHCTVADAHHLLFLNNSFDGHGPIAPCNTSPVPTPRSRNSSGLFGRAAASSSQTPTTTLRYSTSPTKVWPGACWDSGLMCSSRNGSLAHQHAGLLAAHGLVDVTVEPRTLLVRSPTAVDNVLGLGSWAATAAQRGALNPAEARAFEDQFDDAVVARRFTYAVTFFLTAAAVT